MESNTLNAATPDTAAQPAVTSNNMAMIVYVLYICGFFTGVTALVGVILAHVNRKEEKDTVLLSHYNFQIKTFWWGLVWLVIGSITSLIVVGYFIVLFWFVWTIYRCVKGLTHLNRSQPIQ